MKKASILFVLLTACMFVQVRADVWQEYNSLLDKFYAAKYINGTVETSYYYRGSTAPMKIEKGTFYIAKLNKYVNYDGSISINNSKYSVSVDRHNKMILINASGKMEDIEALLGLRNHAKDSVDYKKAIKLVNTLNSSSSKVFEMTFKEKTEYDKIIVEFTGSGMLKKITYVMRPQERYDSNPEKIIVEYKSLFVDQPIDEKVFSEKQVARIDGAKIEPVAAYKGYKIIDYRKLTTYAK